MAESIIQLFLPIFKFDTFKCIRYGIYVLNLVWINKKGSMRCKVRPYISKSQRKDFQELIGHLGKGEASCIAFAKKQNATVVTDDRAARKKCSLMKIPFTGTVGILKASLAAGHLSLPQADEILPKMIAAGFYSPIRSLADIV